MPLPASITPITVTRKYVGPDGEPAAGTVEFRLSAYANVPADNVTVPQVAVTGRLDLTGALKAGDGSALVLPASDDPDWSPGGLTYQVTERITGASVRTFYVNIPAAAVGGTVDLADLDEATPGPALVSYVLAAQVGQSNGVAQLDGTGNVPASQLGNVTGGIQASIVDAKGDLIVATAADAVARLSVGTNGQVLVADSTQVAGVKWGQAAAGNMTYRGAWAPATDYAVNDVVTYAGDTFAVATAHTSGATFALTNLTLLTGRTGRYNVKHYGAKGDGVTDDTASIRAARLAAYNDGVANGWYFAEVYYPPGKYLLSSATVQGGTTKGNAQLPYEVHPVTDTKFTLVDKGAGDPTGLPHWQQTALQRSGSVLVSTIAQPTSGTFGAPSVIGGPTPAQGYGNTGLFNNMIPVIDGLSISVPVNPSTMGLDFSGMAEAIIRSASINASVTPGSGEPVKCTNSWAVGVYMPQTRNNDKCLIQNLSVEGMYFGVIASEHMVLLNGQIIYCDTAVDILDSADFVHIGYLSAELCRVMINAESTGGAGKAKVQIDMLDVEHETSGNFALANIINDPTDLLLGEINVHVLAASGTSDIDPTVNGANNVRIIRVDRDPGAVTAPAVPASTVAYRNTLWRDAYVIISGGTVTAVSIDGQVTGQTSGMFMVPSGRTITLTYSAAPTWKWWLL